MRLVTRKARNLITDERGQDVIEYALLAALISVASYLVIQSIGGSVVLLWEAIQVPFEGP